MPRKKAAPADLDVAFFRYLRLFYKQNKGTIRKHYKALSKRFLDYNDPEQPDSFLRVPQFEALEMYVFLKEYLNNAPVHKIFDEWHHKRGRFEGRSEVGHAGETGSLFGSIDTVAYDAAFRRMKQSAQPYSNYIFALTMGTGKTILMATCIFYEFLLAHKFPKDGRFCHNALVFAPDKTVLQSLREIQTFDRSKVVPPGYVNVLNNLITFHFLDEAGTTLNVLDKSRYNLVISNTQKIILKKQHKPKSPTDTLFSSSKPRYERSGVYAEAADLLALDELENEDDLTTNQRFEKLRRLEQLGIYVDEAHHAFGKNLARDMGAVKDTRQTSLRRTIGELAIELKRAGTHVVACYNYTGTPYMGREIFPEVVYAYGLKEAIDNNYLKKVRVNGYTNPKSTEFVRVVIEDFWKQYEGKRFEGMRPKLAFFASTIDELQNELRPAVESVLAGLGVSTNTVLVNVGDERITTSDDIREFNSLDTFASEKQFILLVNKGKEGWNCRSLFGVALFRKPKSKIFVLQASMRCLRAIEPFQQTGHIYLSDENLRILDEELEQNFRIGVNTFQKAGSQKKTIHVHPVPPPRKIKLRRVRTLYDLREKTPEPGTTFDFDKVDTDKYKLLHVEQEGLLPTKKRKTTDITDQREKRTYSALTLTAEIACYLNRSPIEIECVLRASKEGMDDILEHVNTFNEYLYDLIIPRLFEVFYDLEPYEKTTEEEIELVKVPDKGYYEVTVDPQMVERLADHQQPFTSSTFHLDTYYFDSKPEHRFFNDMYGLLKRGRIKQIYFTGMLTHGQTEFFISYIDPESHTVRSYYPDFLIQKDDDTWVIVEVKGDNKIDDPVVESKATSARQMATASDMTYEIIKGSEVEAGRSAKVLL